KEVYILPHFRSRTDETHLPQKYVNELWQLVNLRFAENAPDFCDPRILPYGDHRAFSVCIGHHGAKFINSKRLEPLSYSLLTKKNGSLGIQFDEKCNPHKEGRQQ